MFELLKVNSIPNKLMKLSKLCNVLNKGNYMKDINYFIKKMRKT